MIEIGSNLASTIITVIGLIIIILISVLVGMK